MKTFISENDLVAIEKVTTKNKFGKYLFDSVKRKATIVRESELPKKAVRINSLVLLWHSLLKKVVELRIVLPHKEDLKRKNVSVFSPISMAIFGRCENEKVEVNIAGIRKELRIIKVSN